MKRVIPIFNKSETTYVQFKDILFIEHDKRISVVRSINEEHRLSLKMDQIEEMLDERFFRSHYSCIVNFQNVKAMRNNQIIFSTGEVLPVGKSTYQRTRKAFVLFLQGLRATEAGLYELPTHNEILVSEDKCR